jgi:hypothetical protein
MFEDLAQQASEPSGTILQSRRVNHPSRFYIMPE